MRGGHWFASGYPGETFSTPLLVGLYGILLSAGKSVFLFSPPLLLGVLGWRRFAKTHTADAYLFAGVFVVELFFFAMWWDWSGDDAWGFGFHSWRHAATIPAIEVLSAVLSSPAGYRRHLRAAACGVISGLSISSSGVNG